eukprot:Amastigsp_a5308_12.p5 type:complete len:113 gc:universal Amastigsp_a5308_12:1642-1304(-)
MVMRDGTACGFMMMSGTMPSREKGRSSWRYVMPQVPFCPWRDENLSPMCGMRTERVRTLQMTKPSRLVVSTTRSTRETSPCALRFEKSRFLRMSSTPSSPGLSGILAVLPMM